jgi:uncharacterized Ntn-hydrolase superfamily protein
VSSPRTRRVRVRVSSSSWRAGSRPPQMSGRRCAAVGSAASWVQLGQVGLVSEKNGLAPGEQVDGEAHHG